MVRTLKRRRGDSVVSNSTKSMPGIGTRGGDTLDHLKRSLLNTFTSPFLDRQSAKRRENVPWHRRLSDASSLVIPVWRSRNLFSNGDMVQPVFLRGADGADLLPHADCIVFLGRLGEHCYFAVGLKENGSEAPEAVNQKGQFKDLRIMGPLLDRDQGSLLAYSRAMVHWHGRHRFCGDCGSPTRSEESGHKRVCNNEKCAREHFPRTDPAVIVLVACEDRCLLGRQRVWPKSLYSVIAGFVEPGESAEQAVAREVWEETSVKVKDVVYHSSQPWPFPGSIMLGFTGKALASDIRLNDQELEDARWFTREDIVAALKRGEVRLPGKISIAYRLIEDWFDAESPSSLTEFLKSTAMGR